MPNPLDLPTGACSIECWAVELVPGKPHFHVVDPQTGIDWVVCKPGATQAHQLELFDANS